MKCNAKTMVRITLALALLLAAGYWTLPQFRGAFEPFILVACALVCPLSMLFMMGSMQSSAHTADVQSKSVPEQKR